MKHTRIAILGASLAGATAAATLRDEGFDGEIHLIGAEAQLPYNRPPLSKGYLRQQEGFEALLVKPAGYYSEQRIELKLGVRATMIDAKQKFVELAGRERVGYDRLLVATICAAW
jgi:3-phenylpropionate/trans-cinnamate dioxygenase ferredoxin reductase component